MPVLDPQDGYNLLAKKYQDYHTKLNNRDRGLFARFLPRDLDGLSLVDLGGGDGRTARWFADKGLDRYLIVDVAEELMEQAPPWTVTVQRDLRESRELHQEFAILLANFLLVHLPDLDWFFSQAVQHMHEESRLILTHHLERTQYVHTVPGKKFKISAESYSFSALEAAAEGVGLTCDYIDLTKQGDAATRIYCCTL